MGNYKTVTRLTDYGPFIVKLILELGCEIGQNDVGPQAFNIHVTRREADGSVLMRKERGAPKALPSVGYQQAVRAYPCTADGEPCPRGSFAALELAEERLGKRIEGDVLASRYIHNCYRVTQLQPFPAPAPGEAPVTGLVFDHCTGDLCPGLAGWSNGAGALQYGWFTPPGAGQGPLPLVVWLHGAGEGGNDPLVAYTGNRVTALSSPEVQRKLGGAAWVLVPQCPTVWMDDGVERLGRSNQSIYTRPLKDCIDQFIASHPGQVDPGRIYLAGVSNGGFMVLRMLADYPGFFAAAAPGCAAFFQQNLTDAVLESLKQTPIWFTHAKRDELVDPEDTSLPIYRRLKAAGAANVHLTYWDEVADPTGQYKDALGRPRAYFNHGVWVLMLDDACRTELDGTRVLQDGEPVTLWEWLGRQHR